MDERQLALLGRKLEALNYTQPLHPACAPLVDNLVSDLVRTTESYRQLKLQCAQQAQEIAGFSTKLEVVRQESGRLLNENNQLHLELIKQAEQHERSDKERYLAAKKLEDQVAELSFLKQFNKESMKAMDRENAQLKQRLDELMAQMEKRGECAAMPSGRAAGRRAQNPQLLDRNPGRSRPGRCRCCRWAAAARRVQQAQRHQAPR